MLTNVRPQFAAFNLSDGGFSDAEHAGEGRNAMSISNRSDCANRSIVEYGSTVPHSSGKAGMFHHPITKAARGKTGTFGVLSVSFWCYPFQVFYGIVGLATVFVVDNISKRLRPKKSVSDQDVRARAFTSAPIKQVDSEVSPPVKLRLNKPRSWVEFNSLDTAHSTKIANFVNVLKLKGWTPFFIRHNGVNYIKITAVLALFFTLSGNGVGQTPTPSESAVQQSAQALINELKAPMNCSASDTLCFAETGQRRLDSAITGLESIVRIDKSRESIVADLNTRIEIRGAIIEDLKRVDANNQTIDANQQRNAALYEGIIRDDKAKIGKLEDKFEACQSRQKWIALLSLGSGLYIGNRIGSGQSINPFSSFQQSSVQSYPLSFYEQTNTEKRLREMFKQK